MTCLPPIGRSLVFAALALACVPTASVQAQDTAVAVTVARPQISAAGALVMAAAVRERAQAHGDKLAIAVVDVGGNLVYFERMDGAVLATVDLALAKARTAVGLGGPTQVFEARARESAEQGMGLLSAHFTLMAGGRPIVIDGQIVGAVAISGAIHGGDDETAIAALDAIGAAH